MRRLLWTFTLFVAGAVGGSAVMQKLTPTALADGPDLTAIYAACETGRPYAVASCYGTFRAGGYDEKGAAVALFSDTPSSRPQYNLATMEQVGSTWGLAFRRSEDAVYAAAFHKRQLPFGPLGPGGIYRIDLETGLVTSFATVPNAGDDEHTQTRHSTDLDGKPWAGKTSLGDLDLSDDEATMFVVNLRDRRIYRISVPDGQVLGSWPHGAALEPWADDARPFGLAVREGWLYHSVTRTAESTNDRAELSVHVYRSRLDGTGTEEVALVPLDYRRGLFGTPVTGRANVDWNTWTPARPRLSGTLVISPEPLAADIDFDAAGNMLVGLRDRTEDLSPVFLWDVVHTWRDDPPALGLGDVLKGTEQQGTWEFSTLAEFQFRSQLTDRAGSGGLAFDRTLDRLMSGAVIDLSGSGSAFVLSPGVRWHDTSSGQLESDEQVCEAADRENRLLPYRSPAASGLFALSLSNRGDPGASLHGAIKVLRSPNAGPGSIGDLESLCRPLVVPTPTSEPQTPTGTATDVPTVPPTATTIPSLEPKAVFLPIAIRDAQCERTASYDVVLVVDASTSMLEPTRSGRSKLVAAAEAAMGLVDVLAPEDRAAVVTFNAGADVAQPLTLVRDDVRAALGSIVAHELTRIHLGIDVAGQELAASLAAGRTPVMVVLTDGRSNPEPVSLAELSAERAKAAGVRVFTVGLGDDVEADALRRIASSPGDYFAAPDGEALLAIYRRIGRELPCPKDAFWPYEARAVRTSPIR